MVKDSGDELVSLLGKLALVRGIEEDILPVLEEGHIRMHAGAVDAFEGLGHESRMQAVPLGRGLDGQLEGHDLVGRSQGVRVLEVNLVLALGNLVVGSFNFEAHLLEEEGNLTTGVGAPVQGSQVEVAGIVTGRGRGPSFLVGGEEEELKLGSDVEGIALVRCLLKLSLQNISRVAGKRCAVGIIDVADETGNLSLLGSPGENHEAVEVRAQVLVGLVDAGKSLDGGAVNHDLIVHGLLQLASRDGNILQLAEDVGELHTDEGYVLVLNDFSDIILCHSFSPYSFDMTNVKRQRGT